MSYINVDLDSQCPNLPSLDSTPEAQAQRSAPPFQFRAKPEKAGFKRALSLPLPAEKYERSSSVQNASTLRERISNFVDKNESQNVAMAKLNTKQRKGYLEFVEFARDIVKASHRNGVSSGHADRTGTDLSAECLNDILTNLKNPTAYAQELRQYNKEARKQKSNNNLKPDNIQNIKPNQAQVDQEKAVTTLCKPTSELGFGMKRKHAETLVKSLCKLRGATPSKIATLLCDVRNNESFSTYISPGIPIPIPIRIRKSNSTLSQEITRTVERTLNAEVLNGWKSKCGLTREEIATIKENDSTANYRSSVRWSSSFRHNYVQKIRSNYGVRKCYEAATEILISLGVSPAAAKRFCKSSSLAEMKELLSLSSGDRMRTWHQDKLTSRANAARNRSEGASDELTDHPAPLPKAITTQDIQAIVDGEDEYDDDFLNAEDDDQDEDLYDDVSHPKSHIGLNALGDTETNTATGEPTIIDQSGDYSQVWRSESNTVPEDRWD
ncbi:hypothetical protein AB1K70_03215 [Bremerella sp. JC770]|uniref:hypothetical protein n=1 Tax=Bremerella sp. JC770 TaxID=3232137 RepID=UPI00345824E0